MRVTLTSTPCTVSVTDGAARIYHGRTPDGTPVRAHVSGIGFMASGVRPPSGLDLVLQDLAAPEAAAVSPPRLVAYDPAPADGLRHWLLIEQVPDVVGDLEPVVIDRHATRAEAEAPLRTPAWWLLFRPNEGWVAAPGMGTTTDLRHARRHSQRAAAEALAATTRPTAAYAVLGNGTLVPWTPDPTPPPRGRKCRSAGGGHDA